MTPAKKTPKPKRLAREPIIGRAARSGEGWAFSFELQSFVVNGEPLDPVQAADDLAGVLVWVIGQKRADIAEANGHENTNP